jgi:hypothetical protein
MRPEDPAGYLTSDVGDSEDEDGGATPNPAPPAPTRKGERARKRGRTSDTS